MLLPIAAEGPGYISDVQAKTALVAETLSTLQGVATGSTFGFAAATFSLVTNLWSTLLVSYEAW